MPKASDLRGDLVTGQLSALAGLRSLRDLDLQLVRKGEVLGRDAEASRRDLLDPRVCIGVKARRILASLARVRARSEAVESACNGLVRFGRQRTVRHGASREAPHDRFGRLDIVERNGGCLRKLEQVA